MSVASSSVEMRYVKSHDKKKLDHCCSGMLGSVDWYLSTDHSGQPSYPVCKGCPKTSVTNCQSMLNNI